MTVNDVEPRWWSLEREHELADLWAAGRSASEIDRTLGTSKNAVIGKADRLCLDRHRNAVKFNPHLLFRAEHLG